MFWATASCHRSRAEREAALWYNPMFMTRLGRFSTPDANQVCHSATNFISANYGLFTRPTFTVGNSCPRPELRTGGIEALDLHPLAAGTGDHQADDLVPLLHHLDGRRIPGDPGRRVGAHGGSSAGGERRGRNREGGCAGILLAVEKGFHGEEWEGWRATRVKLRVIRWLDSSVAGRSLMGRVSAYPVTRSIIWGSTA